jgi:hypothetical protein
MTLPIDRENAADAAAERLRDLARRHTEAAIAALVEVMQDREAAPMARNAAANAVLQWGHGRPGGEMVRVSSKKQEQMVIICWKPENSENIT